MAGTSAGAKKAWLSRKRGGGGGSSLEATMRAQRMAVVRSRVKGSASARAGQFAKEMRASFKKLGIQAVPWRKGLLAVARNMGMKDYDMERRTGLPRANMWHVPPKMTRSARARLRAAEAQIKRS